jgi:hypothetical protein
MSFAFEKLIVYQKTVDLADKICTTISKFPNGYYFLRDQLNRALLSILPLARYSLTAEPWCGNVTEETLTINFIFP